MPELRRHTFFARCFLSRRSAAFDAALIGVATGALARSPLPFAAAAPYAWVAVKRSRRWRQDATVALAGAVAADAMGFVSLARGSVESRTVLL